MVAPSKPQGTACASDSDRARPIGPPGRRAKQHRGARQPQQRPAPTADPTGRRARTPRPDGRAAVPRTPAIRRSAAKHHAAHEGRACPYLGRSRKPEPGGSRGALKGGPAGGRKAGPVHRTRRRRPAASGPTERGGHSRLRNLLRAVCQHLQPQPRGVRCASASEPGSASRRAPPRGWGEAVPRTRPIARRRIPARVPETPRPARRRACSGRCSPSGCITSCAARPLGHWGQGVCIGARAGCHCERTFPPRAGSKVRSTGADERAGFSAS